MPPVYEQPPLIAQNGNLMQPAMAGTPYRNYPSQQVTQYMATAAAAPPSYYLYQPNVDPAMNVPVSYLCYSSPHGYVAPMTTNAIPTVCPPPPPACIK